MFLRLSSIEKNKQHQQEQMDCTATHTWGTAETKGVKMGIDVYSKVLAMLNCGRKHRSTDAFGGGV
jgi:hypothetical protein